MDEGEALSSNVSNTRYIIFSACGYGNIGDDAIMLGTARYLITRHNATDLFIFSYSPKETQQLLEKAGLASVATIRCGFFKRGFPRVRIRLSFDSSLFFPQRWAFFYLHPFI